MGSERSSTGSSKANAETLPGRWSHEEIKTVEKLLGELIKAESDGISPQLSRAEVWLQCSTMLSESGFNRSAPALQRRFGPWLKICKEKSSYQLIPEDAVTTATANSEEKESTVRQRTTS
jgi:predicted nucleic acid-binding protein